MKITRIEPFVLNLPFATPRVERHMYRANAHGERVNIWRIEADGYVRVPEKPGLGIGGTPQAHGEEPTEDVQHPLSSSWIRCDLLDGDGGY
jgi:hypothetical protein